MLFFSSGCCFCSSEVSEQRRWACLKMGYRGIPPIFPPIMATERDLIQIKPIILIIYWQYSLGFRGKNCRNQRFWNSFASVVGTDAEKLKMEAVLRPAGKRRLCFCFRRYIYIYLYNNNIHYIYGKSSDVPEIHDNHDHIILTTEY